MLGSVLLAGCGFSPPAPTTPTATAACSDADSPTPDTVQQAIAGLPPVGWVETARGHANDCRLQWVQVTADNATASTPGQVLFFDRNTPLGTPTADPKPYITVLPSGPESVMVQYQWLVATSPTAARQGWERCASGSVGTAHSKRSTRSRTSEPLAV